MFQVMAVDDEPVSLEFICSLVETRCTGFSIMGTAQNGRECLERMASKQPDVLLTDARMPVMDGIELAKQVRLRYPSVLIVVVSGFQEFDYVHGALLCGAHDYLLKPLQPSAFTALFSHLRDILESQLLADRNRMLSKLSKGERLEHDDVARCFPDPAYDCVLVRKNGLPKRFAHSGPPEIFEDNEDISLSIFGRDEMERIYLRPATQGLDAFVEEVIAHEKVAGQYVTAVSTRKPFPIEHFADVLRRFYRALDVRTVLGVTQAVYLEDPFGRVKLPATGSDELKRLETYFETGNMPQAREELSRLMGDWEKRKMPQLWLERQLRYVLFLAVRAGSGGRMAGVGEHLLDDAFYNICSMREMGEYMNDLLFVDSPREGDPPSRMDTPENFERICNYVQAHLTEPMSIQDVAQTFGISQSYLSKMFRRFRDQSFNAFLTDARMNYACTLMADDPGLYVKDVASMVGYTDPFYFSKSFRAHTGRSPKDYLDTLHHEGGSA